MYYQVWRARFGGNCVLDTTVNSKGRNATLSFSAYPTLNKPVHLFDSGYSTLMIGGNVTWSAAVPPIHVTTAFPRISGRT